MPRAIVAHCSIEAIPFRLNIRVHGLFRAPQNNFPTSMISSPLFRHLPLSNAASALNRMTRRRVTANEVIMTQGDPADYFYVIETGNAEIWQMGLYDVAQKKVADIGPGDHFGADALVSGDVRNATVRMYSDGTLLILTRDQFKTLIAQPMIHEVDAHVAKNMIRSGRYKLLDVRYEEEWEEQRLPGVILSPLHQLRNTIAELDISQKYITYCHSGKRSAVAAMILGQNGIDAVSLRGGINEWPFETEGRVCSETGVAA